MRVTHSQALTEFVTETSSCVHSSEGWGGLLAIVEIDAYAWIMATSFVSGISERYGNREVQSGMEERDNGGREMEGCARLLYV